MEKELSITGMHCHHCVHAVRQALGAMEGVEVQDVEIGRARVRVTGSALDESRVREALDEEGYELKSVADAREV